VPVFVRFVPKAKSPMPVIVPLLAKARRGQLLIGGTPSFMSGKIYINKRKSALPGHSLAYYEH